MGSNVPFGGAERFLSVRLLDETGRGNDSADRRADLRAVSPNFFQLLQMPLRRGRVFTANDNLPSTPGVAIVNETMARKLAPAGDILGRRIAMRGGVALPSYEIVGVVADARSTGTSVGVWDEVYIPYAQSNSSFFYLIVRSAHPPTFVGAAVLMLVVAALAAYIPARRAARTDPLVSLRYE